MRVLIVTPRVSHEGGTERSLLWLTQGLDQRADVTLFAGHVASQAVLGGVRAKRLPMFRRPRFESYLTFLVSASFVVGFLRLFGRLRGVSVIATGGDCLFADYVYAHFCAAAWLEMIRSGAVTLQASTLRQRLRNGHHRAFLAVAAHIEGRIYRRRSVKRIIAVSQGLRNDLVRYYAVEPERIVVVPNMIDERMRLTASELAEARRRTRNQHGIGEGEFVALFAAAGDFKRKGLLEVIDAVALLRGTPVTLLVVGQDDLAHYRREAHNRGVADRVIFAGLVGDPERYYAAADCFVYPSRYETFGLVTYEAAATGLPLVVTRVHGSEELVRDGVNGYFIEPSGESIAGKLRTLQGDPALRGRMATAARLASLPYTREAVVDGVLRAIAGSGAMERGGSAGVGG